MLSPETIDAAKASDALAAPQGEGYLAQFHDLIPELVVVFAPCGCRFVVRPDGESVLTVCLTEQCSFDWIQAADAYTVLVQKHSKVVEIKGVSVKSENLPAV